MPKCYNCGCDVPADDKTRLCDNCKKIILPFIKFMDASTSSSMRRLLSNEKNLRNAGVTDKGMEYLLKICELHDRQKLREREEREAAKAAAIRDAEPAKLAEELFPQDDYTSLQQMELPVDEPLDLYREPYGGFLTGAMCVLILLGAAALILEIVIGEMSIPVILCSVGLMIGGYTLHVCKKLLHDLEEIKKRFR
jgi:hypothetical protein